MARTYQKMRVTFERDIRQQQAITVAVPAGVDEETAKQVARQLATVRLKEKGWKALILVSRDGTVPFDITVESVTDA